MEFMFLVIASFFIAFGLLVAFVDLSADRTTQKAYVELLDLGRAVQQEFLIASELEDGYTRSFFIPDQLNALPYTIVSGNATQSESYFQFLFENQEVYYAIPPINGALVKGTNTIQKINGTLYLT